RCSCSRACPRRWPRGSSGAAAAPGPRGRRDPAAVGDPECDAVARRGDEEQVGDAVAARIRLSLTYLRPLLEVPGVDFRVHDRTLYSSILRFDDDMLVNLHTYGASAAQSPVMHVRRSPAGGCSRTTWRASSGCGGMPGRLRR